VKTRTLIFVLVCCAVVPAELANGAIRVLTVAFTGGELGSRVGTILNLQLWRSLTISGKAGNKITTVPAVVEWSPEPIVDSSFDGVQRIGRARGVSLLLWGDVFEFGHEIVAQPYLSIITADGNTPTPEVTWTNQSTVGDVPQLSVSLPRLYYELPAVFLGEEKLEGYSQPSLVDVYDGAEPPNAGRLGSAIGKLGSQYVGLVSRGNFTKVVTADNRKGWICLPELPGEKEVVDFAAGLARLLCQDYDGAATALAPVSGSHVTDGPLKIDSLLLQALAAAHLNTDPTPFVEAAEEMNPFLKATAEYKITNLVWKSQMGTESEKEKAVADLQSTYLEDKYMFTPVDPWFQKCQTVLASLPSSRALVGLGPDRRLKVKIGVSMALFGDLWSTAVRDAMSKWAANHPDVELSIVDANNDSDNQKGQVDNFLAQGMDAVAILPVDPAATGPMTKAVVKAGKPLVYVNRLPSNLPKGVIYCGSNSIDAGIINMEELGKAMGGKGNLAILMGEVSNEVAIDRTDGIKRIIKEKFPDIKIVRQQTGDWKRESAKTIMENWLASGQEIDGVASNNDEMALGALQAIKAAGKLRKIPVGGTDGSYVALESLDKGELNHTVFQDPVTEGEEAVNAAYLLVKKEPNPKVVDDRIWIPYEAVTKENYKTFLK
jgi:inositol transport system substrate-binding protein